MYLWFENSIEVLVGLKVWMNNPYSLGTEGIIIEPEAKLTQEGVIATFDRATIVLKFSPYFLLFQKDFVAYIKLEKVKLKKKWSK